MKINLILWFTGTTFEVVQTTQLVEKYTLQKTYLGNFIRKTSPDIFLSNQFDV